MVFSRARVAVSVLGCFWHGCPSHTRLATGQSREWWRQKLAINAARDRDTRFRLEQAGWLVVEVWECDDIEEAADAVAAAVRRRR